LERLQLASWLSLAPLAHKAQLVALEGSLEREGALVVLEALLQPRAQSTW
jgi:hypothetical protein